MSLDLFQTKLLSRIFLKYYLKIDAHISRVQRSCEIQFSNPEGFTYTQYQISSHLTTCQKFGNHLQAAFLINHSVIFDLFLLMPTKSSLTEVNNYQVPGHLVHLIRSYHQIATTPKSNQINTNISRNLESSVMWNILLRFSRLYRPHVPNFKLLDHLTNLAGFTNNKSFLKLRITW